MVSPFNEEAIEEHKGKGCQPEGNHHSGEVVMRLLRETMLREPIERIGKVPTARMGRIQFNIALCRCRSNGKGCASIMYLLVENSFMMISPPGYGRQSVPAIARRRRPAAAYNNRGAPSRLLSSAEWVNNTTHRPVGLSGGEFPREQRFAFEVGRRSHKADTSRRYLPLPP